MGSDAVLVLFDRESIEAQSGEAGEVSKETLIALDLVSHLAPWAYANRLRLVLLSDWATALVAAMSLFGWVPPRPAEAAERAAAPILFAQLPISPARREVEIEPDPETVTELRDLGLIDLDQQIPDTTEQLLRRLLGGRKWEFIVALTRNPGVIEVLTSYKQRVPRYTIPSVPLEGVPELVTLSASRDVLAGLPSIETEDDAARESERRAREAAGILADLLGRLSKPGRAEMDGLGRPARR